MSDKKIITKESLYSIMKRWDFEKFLNNNQYSPFSNMTEEIALKKFSLITQVLQNYLKREVQFTDFESLLILKTRKPSFTLFEREDLFYKGIFLGYLLTRETDQENYDPCFRISLNITTIFVKESDVNPAILADILADYEAYKNQICNKT